MNVGTTIGKKGIEAWENGKCVNCYEKEGVFDHHLSYAKDFTVPLCGKCHFIVHEDEGHPLYPIDRLHDGGSNVRVAFTISPFYHKIIEDISDMESKTKSDILRELVGKGLESHPSVANLLSKHGGNYGR